MNKNYDQAGLLNDAANLQEYGLPERQVLAAQAQVAATLAVAYEQRTANLIALMGQFDPDYDWLVKANNASDSPEGKRLATMSVIGERIAERLGI